MQAVGHANFSSCSVGYALYDPQFLFGRAKQISRNVVWTKILFSVHRSRKSILAVARNVYA